MSIPEIESMQDARRYSELCEAGEREAEEQYSRGMQINVVTTAIRKCDLDMDGVRQILITLSSTASSQGISKDVVEMLDTLSEQI